MQPVRDEMVQRGSEGPLGLLVEQERLRGAGLDGGIIEIEIEIAISQRLNQSRPAADGPPHGSPPPAVPGSRRRPDRQPFWCSVCVCVKVVDQSRRMHGRRATRCMI